MDARKCTVCGKTFIPKGSRHAYCSLECKKIGSKKPKTEKKKKSKCVNADLVEDAVKARELGMSYGQYQAMLYAKAHPIQRRCT